MNWHKVSGISPSLGPEIYRLRYRSDCGSYTISKRSPYSADGRVVERYPWMLCKGRSQVTFVGAFGLLGEAKAYAESLISPLEQLARQI